LENLGVVGVGGGPLGSKLSLFGGSEMKGPEMGSFALSWGKFKRTEKAREGIPRESRGGLLWKGCGKGGFYGSVVFKQLERRGTDTSKEPPSTILEAS